MRWGLGFPASAMGTTAVWKACDKDACPEPRQLWKAEPSLQIHSLEGPHAQDLGV